MPKHTILFLAANPFEADRVLLGKELSAIQEQLERSRHRDRFSFVTRSAMNPRDVQRELRALQPTVIHFTGHGRAQVLASPAVELTLGAADSSVKLVVLSRCYTDAQADAVLEHVPCVVGTGGTISDTAARSFASAFTTRWQMAIRWRSRSCKAVMRPARRACRLETGRSSGFATPWMPTSWMHTRPQLRK